MATSLKLTSRDVAFLIVLTALPLLGYQFGMGNQVEQFPIIGRFHDPNFLVGDFYTDSAIQFGPRFYYSHFVAGLTNVAALPAVILVLTCAVNFGLALVTFWCARTKMGVSAAGAATAASLAVANSSFALGLAGYLRFESFQPASISIPLSLAGFVWLVVGKRYVAATAFFLASLFHPLIGLEVALIAYASCAISDLIERRTVVEWPRYVPSGLLFAGLLAVAWILPSSTTEDVGMSSEEFFSIVPAFRSPHHYLGTTFPLSHYLQVGAFLLAMALIAYEFRNDAQKFRMVTRLAVATVIVVALCAASLVLVDSLHDRIASSAQVFRMLMVVKWAGFILFGAAAGRWLSTGRPVQITAPFLVLVSTGEAQAYAMLLAVVAIWVVEQKRSGRVLEFGIAAGLAVIAGYLTMSIGAREEAVRAVLAGVSIVLLYLTPLAVPVASAIAVTGTCALALFGWFNRDLHLSNRAIFLPSYQWSDINSEEADIARWVKGNSPPKAIWITPPRFESFRLLAERPIVVDFTSVPLQESGMREWRRRIDKVYGPTSGTGREARAVMEANYRAVTPAKLRELSSTYRAKFAVLDRETAWPGPVLYNNGTYKAVSLDQQH